ncbi:hypothetical protein J6590_079297 [Homalodisca vitripennis]|nr:hypothetical protein J6590_097936 [Homalodisca vitripennis]KAG8280559.1 hypothetical protein J6590_079293 [Homalodisca vitripennis]KAG8280563.1 hypothetical protein J6590_079297 [Homalodisca vitripennis]
MLFRARAQWAARQRCNTTLGNVVVCAFYPAGATSGAQWTRIDVRNRNKSPAFSSRHGPIVLQNPGQMLFHSLLLMGVPASREERFVPSSHINHRLPTLDYFE